MHINFMDRRALAFCISVMALISHLLSMAEVRREENVPENVAGIVGMAKAAEIAYGNMRKRVQKEIMLRNYLIERVMHEIPDAKLNGHRSVRLPGNVNFSFKGLEGASLLILLDEDGICASGGSACNTGEERISYVIKALGVPEEYAPGTIRITLCGDTTRADVDAALVSLKRNIAVLRG